MEKRGVIPSTERWRELRDLRNAIAHDYVLESVDRVLADALTAAPELLATVAALDAYTKSKGYCS